MPTTSRHRRLLVAAALAVLYLVWGSIYLAIRYGLESYPPLLFAAAQNAAGLALYVALRLGGAAAPTRRQWRNCAVVGVLLIAAGTGLLCISEQSISSSLAAIEVASVPLFATAIALAFGQRARRGDWFGLGLGFAGVVVLNLDGQLAGSAFGVAAVLGAALFWALGSVWSQHRDMPAPLVSAAAQMICGSAVLFVLALLRGERWPAVATPNAQLALLYCAVAGCVLSYVAYVYLLHTVRPALATSYAYVNPPVAVLLGVWLAGEHVGLRGIAAMVLILAGVAWIALRGGATQPSAT